VPATAAELATAYALSLLDHHSRGTLSAAPCIDIAACVPYPPSFRLTPLERPTI
jgi:hypothetical protein